MIDSHLYTIFLNALDQLYRGAEALGPECVQYIQKHSQIFKGQARRSQGKARSVKQLNDEVVMAWARTYARRKREARAFIIFIHEQELLRSENLLPIPGGERKRAWPLSEFSLTERQLALAIVRDDFVEHHPTRPLTPKGLDELVIQRGNKLLRAKSSS